MSTVKKLTTCAICTALCYVLPLGFHAVSLGWGFSPMHIPVLLCGLVCGIAGPVLSGLLSGMPGTAQLAYMIPRLCAYGPFCGLLAGGFRTPSPSPPARWRWLRAPMPATRPCGSSTTCGSFSAALR